MKESQKYKSMAPSCCAAAAGFTFQNVPPHPPAFVDLPECALFAAAIHV